ncbi:MAG: hypothetical protein AAF378_14510 [Cyanobacteria bacterium P01_A01_bin.84]
MPLAAPVAAKALMLVRRITLPNPYIPKPLVSKNNFSSHLRLTIQKFNNCME